MNTAAESFPRLVAHRTILLGIEDAVAHAPCHSVEEQCRTSHLRSGIVRRHKAGIPIAVTALQLDKGVSHKEIILQKLLIVRVVGIDSFHNPHQCGINPSVAPTPVAILTVGFLVRCFIYTVAPPQTIGNIEQSTTVTGIAVAVHGIIEVVAVTTDFGILGIYGHCHLYGINPPPVVLSAGSHLMV